MPLKIKVPEFVLFADCFPMMCHLQEAAQATHSTLRHKNFPQCKAFLFKHGLH